MKRVDNIVTCLDIVTFLNIANSLMGSDRIMRLDSDELCYII